MKTIEEMAFLHIIEQLQEEVTLLSEENRLLRESIKRYFNERKN